MMGFRSLALLALGGCVQAAGLPSVKEVAERFDAAQSRVETMQAPFTLTIRRALLRTPTVTRGTVYLQGTAFVHFAFQPPEDLILHLTPKALVSYSPLAGEGELLKIGFFKNADRRFLGLGQKLSYLSDWFQIGLSEGHEVPNTWMLTLTPTGLSLRKRIKSMLLWVDRDTYLPRQVQWVERSGDEWHLELGALQINQGLPAAVTGFKVPAGVPLRSEFSFFGSRRK